ncbi:MAG: SpoIIE family protein phosphatase [Bacteroidetes bacterium]|nr:SpoIIE family protein phosphatase [Bacteroidota bacterium]
MESIIGYIFSANLRGKNIKFIHVFFILFLSSLTTKILAQSTDINFEQIFLEQGLSQSIVKSICQDKNGFMYFGTEDGLNRFDGYKFKVLRHNPEDSNSLSYNDITSLLVDSKGIMWIGTFNAGLNRFDQSKKIIKRFQNELGNPNSLSHNNINAILEDNSGNLWIGTDFGLNRLVIDSATKNFSFLHFLNDPKNKTSISNNTVYSIYQDKTGNIWIGTQDGLNKIISEQTNYSTPIFVNYKFDSKDKRSISNNIVRAILQDSYGNLWIGTDNGLNKLIKNNNSESFINYKNDPNNLSSISHNQIYSLCEDNYHNLWIGTNGGGINIYDKNNNKFIRYINDPLNRHTLSYNEIRSIFKDKSGIMWIGTYGAGINKVTRGARQFYHYMHRPNESNSLSHAIVWAMYEDKEGILWIGTHGGGLDRLNRKTNTYNHYRNNPSDLNSLSNNIVRNIIEDNEGFLWIGTHGGGVNKFDRKTGKFKQYRNNPNDPGSLTFDEVRKIYKDRSGTVWIGTYGRGLEKFDKQTEKFIHYKNDPNIPNSLSNNFVREIYEDRSGNFWVGTEGGGLNKFDRNKETFSSYRSDPKGKNKINNDYIFSIYEDKLGNLWIGTWGGGLNKFNPQTETFNYFTSKDGLPSDAIYAILADENENLWLSTNKGLSKFNPQTTAFKNYTASDGLQDNEFNGGSYFKSNSGEMFFGGINGFNSFYPKEIKDNTFLPPVIITSFQKFNNEIQFDKPISDIKEIELSYQDYVFSFEFTSLDFAAPQKNKYAYKMEGLDKDWIYTNSEKRFASYTTLNPGNYRFRVKATNSDGIWNEKGASINIFITPPYWRTWWFTTLISGLVITFGFIFYKNRLKNIRMKVELKTAHDAQMSIMPNSAPVIEGLDISNICIPANEVGGDFFDYFWLNNDKSKFGIIVGDVSGKGMKAAMTAVMTNGMLISEINEANSINTILKKVNTPLYLKTNKEMFTAVCLAVINVGSKELSFTNAGLPNPLIKTNNKIKFIKSEGPRFPLGMMKEVNYLEEKLQLNKGDLLIFMSDGISEAQNSTNELYGEERLKILLMNLKTSEMSASEIKVEIIKDVEKFSGKQQRHDDMTVIVIKIN